MIAVIAANDSWKLGPAADSGSTSITHIAPVATSRNVIASRPIANATNTSNAATHEL